MRSICCASPGRRKSESAGGQESTKAAAATPSVHTPCVDTPGSDRTTPAIAIGPDAPAALQEDPFSMKDYVTSELEKGVKEGGDMHSKIIKAQNTL